MSEFTRMKQPQYHIEQERAHLQLARLCMCYMSILLEHSGEADGSSNGYDSSPIRLTSCPLFRYVLEDSLGHFEYVGSKIGLILGDIKLLARDIGRRSWVWDNMILLVVNSTTLSWPVSTHDLQLYILVAFAPNSFLRSYLHRPLLEPKGGTNPLIYAAYFNKHEQAQTLLSRGIKLNYRGWETDGSSRALPIEVAMRNGHYSMVALFVANGSIVSPQIFTRLLSHYYGNVPSSTKKMLFQTDDFMEAVNEHSNDPCLQSFEVFRDILIGSIHGQDLISVVRRALQVGPHFS